MTISGHIYGVVLNDSVELNELAPQFGEKPYAAPPVAPVVYMKPRTAIARGPVRVAKDEELVASPTLALLFARDASRCSAAEALDCVGGMALAIDFALPQPDYYRPAVSRKNRDGFLALGDWAAPAPVENLSTLIDGKAAHSWGMDRLKRDPATLIADLSVFMTLRAGDVLLIGLPGDAPHVHAGQSLRVESAALPAVEARLEEVQS
ncbi:fumarylacetoacetate hydrolase family protein [Novosphingobium beihaiensis]|uniref:Fumarylacetoacetate hydrolase family protein n=1 Tax=Novosphingobium beihaiensis TaxID=2930389 RepID=A0ABT0BLX4_9SPHN|nr:fumarylacetoacetate hydrolase family protein [Novosphingobium beihaiensis]MCJ2185853.1 fumarylacetoacetate hydrolase family protein [Novosphingobium beihaiensis]